MASAIQSTMFTDVTTIQPAATQLGLSAVYAVNNSGATAWIQIFDALQANVTLGTTKPLFSFPVNGTGGFQTMEFGPLSLKCDNALTIAATTAPTNATGMGTGVHVQVFVN